jgi:hypothetical protein
MMRQMGRMIQTRKVMREVAAIEEGKGLDFSSHRGR